MHNQYKYITYKTGTKELDLTSNNDICFLLFDMIDFCKSLKFKITQKQSIRQSLSTRYSRKYYQIEPYYMRVLTDEEYINSPCANDSSSISLMNTDKKNIECYSIQIFFDYIIEFKETIPYFDKSVLETLFLRTFQHNSQHPSQKIIVDESFILQHGLEYFIRYVYINNIVYIQDNVRIENVLHPNCRKSNIDDLRFISYDFDTEEYSAYQCEDLQNVLDHFDSIIIDQLRRHEYDYNLTHSNNIPVLLGLKNAEQIGRRVLTYNNQYSNDAIAVRQCVSVFFFLLLTGIDSGSIINDIRTINEQFDELLFPRLNSKYIDYNNLQTIATTVNGRSDINVTLLMAFVLSRVLHHDAEFEQFFQSLYNKVNQNPAINLSNDILQYFMKQGFRYVCLSYTIPTNNYKGYLIHSTEQINGPEPTTINKAIYSKLSSELKQYMQTLSTQYNLQYDDVTGVIAIINHSRNSQNSIENIFMSKIPSTFEFEKVDYYTRCIIPCTDLLTI